MLQCTKSKKGNKTTRNKLFVYSKIKSEEVVRIPN